MLKATIKILRKGYSYKLRHLLRTHRVNVSSIAEVLQEEQISIIYCKTDEQVADIFTKPLDKTSFLKFRDILLNVQGPKH